MDIQTNIDEGLRMVEQLLASPQVAYKDLNIADVPDEPGMYLLSDHVTGEFLYVGKGKRTRGRIKNHWDGSSSFRTEGLRSIAEAKEWLRSSVSIRWLTQNELTMSITVAAHFAIGALRPKYNL